MAVLIPYRGRLITAQQLRSTRDWKRIAKAACPPGSMCHLCGQPILFGLRRNHPRGPSADHIVPIEQGGAPLDPANVAACHHGCNSAKQDGELARTEAWID